MTPNRTALKPLAIRNAASSLLNPEADGSNGATLYTSLSPCRRTTCPSLLVNQVPVVEMGSSDPLVCTCEAAPVPYWPTAPWLPRKPALPPAPPRAGNPVELPPTPLLPPAPPSPPPP